MRKTRRTIAAALATAAAVAAFAGSASAASGTQQVVGTTIGTLALGVPATPAALDTNFNPGYTASNSTPAALVVTSTANSWTLSVDDATNNGHLKAAVAGCTGSEASTTHQLKVLTSGGTTVTHAGAPVTVAAPSGGSGATVATGSLANSLLATYSLLIDPTEQMLTGCAYTTTVNWTVQ